MSNGDDNHRPHIEITTAPTQQQERAARRLTALGRGLLILGLAAGLAAGWIVLPAMLYGRQEQPLPFNHLVHVETAAMSCDDCHSFGDDGSYGGIPALSACVDCHSEAQGNTEAERRLVDDFVTPAREIPWLVYARQPDNVYFSHAPHVRLAKIECRRCHGDHGQSATTPVYQFNLITGYSRNIWGPRISGGGPNKWDSMKMSDCVACHAERGVRDHCLMCHK